MDSHVAPPYGKVFMNTVEIYFIFCNDFFHCCCLCWYHFVDSESFYLFDR